MISFIQKFKDWDLKRILEVKNIALLGIVFVFCLLDVYPKLWRLSMLNQQIGIANKNRVVLSQQEKVQQEQQLKTEMAQLTQQLQFLRETTRAIQAKIDPDKNVGTITLEIENLAVASKRSASASRPLADSTPGTETVAAASVTVPAAQGIEITSIKSLDNIAKDRYEILPLDIGLRSEYAQLIKFLAKIEKSLSATSIQQVVLELDKANDSFLDVRVRLYVLSSAKSPALPAVLLEEKELKSPADHLEENAGAPR